MTLLRRVLRVCGQKEENQGRVAVLCVTPIPMARLNWKQLLCRDRDVPDPKSGGDQRFEFERDYDRIVNSSAFRRLQDKAQVFPLERTDFIHTRLTHSLEVERLGVAMAHDVYRQNRKLFPGAEEAEIGSLMSAACLAHDIGNPPFGHSGEKSIQLWFRKYLEAHSELGLSEQQRADFLRFEGNAQTLRVVSTLQVQWEKEQPGLHLTYATLSVLMKYAASSLTANPKGSQSQTKPGYFSSENHLVETIRERTGTGQHRHPLTFLMEAADDMAYSAIDIEDALKKQVVDLQLVCDTLNKKYRGERDLQELVRKYLMVRRGGRVAADPEHLMRYQRFRIKILGFMLRRVVAAFLANFDAMMEGSFDQELVKVSEAEVAWDGLRSIAKNYVYKSTPVAMMEATGDAVIRQLLDRFVPAVLGKERHDSKHPDAKLYLLISPVWRSLFERKKLRDGEASHAAMQLVTDFICGMTDTYALDVLRRISGTAPAYG
jgi:dGTPase